MRSLCLETLSSSAPTGWSRHTIPKRRDVRLPSSQRPTERALRGWEGAQRRPDGGARTAIASSSLGGGQVAVLRLQVASAGRATNAPYASLRNKYVLQSTNEAP